MLHVSLALASTTPVTWFKGWDLTGNFTTIDLIAASTSALNGALLAPRPDHFKNFTIVGILAMALLGGLGGGITRDVLLADVPVALTNPAYITLALAFGVLGYMLARAETSAHPNTQGRGPRAAACSASAAPAASCFTRPHSNKRPRQDSNLRPTA